MKRLLGALAVVLAPAGSLLAGSAGIAPSNQRIGRELDNLQIIDLSVPVQTSESASIAERMAFYKIPGVSAAVINNFAVEWAEGAGHLKAGDAASVDEEAVLQTGSVSKFVTAVLALHFVDRGMLDLDADANRALVSRKVPDTPSTTRHQVTLRHLLSHQSGIPAQPQLEDSASLLQILKGERPATNPPAVPDTIPGSRWNYSNIGYAVIQLLLEDLTGKAIS